jgi:hypothetical protein
MKVSLALWRVLLALVAVVGGSLACSTAGTGTGSGVGEGEGEGESNTPLATLVSTTPLDAAPLVTAGLAVAARADGRFAVAYFVDNAATIACATFGGEDVDGDLVTLQVDDEQPDGTVRTRVVDDRIPVVREAAVDMAVDPSSDALIIAYNGGEPTDTYCGATDLRVAVESGATFVTTTAATTGDTGAPCRGTAGGDPYCAQGAVVGLYPALAVRADDVAIGYLDSHFGFADTDINQSDFELARGGSAAAVALSSLNVETGAGYHGDAAFVDGRLLMAHNVRGNNNFIDDNGANYVVDDGLYATVEGDAGLEDRLVLARIQTESRVAVGGVGGRLAIAFHNSTNEQLLLFSSVDGGMNFTPQPIEVRGRSGRSPSVVDIGGQLVLVYGHCRDDQNRDGCDAAGDGVRVAVPGASVNAPPRTTTLLGDDEDLDGVGVHAVASGANEIVAASFITNQNRIVVQRVAVQP